MKSRHRPKRRKNREDEPRYDPERRAAGMGGRPMDARPSKHGGKRIVTFHEPQRRTAHDSRRQMLLDDDRRRAAAMVARARNAGVPDKRVRVMELLLIGLNLEAAGQVLKMTRQGVEWHVSQLKNDVPDFWYGWRRLNARKAKKEA